MMHKENVFDSALEDKNAGDIRLQKAFQNVITWLKNDSEVPVFGGLPCGGILAGNSQFVS